jgi:hypothetical protein
MNTKQSIAYIAALAIIGPITAELLTGSTTLSEITNPLVAFFTLVPYSLLLIWLAYLNSHALKENGAIFLLPIAGIVIEGILTRSFFDPNFPDMSQLAGVGYFAGVQWPWTFSLIASHLMTTFLAPITIAQALIKGDYVVNKRIAHISLGILSALALFAIIFVGKVPIIHILIAIAAIWLCTKLSRKFALHTSHTRSWNALIMFAIGFLIAPVNWLTSFFMADKPVLLIIFLQLIFLSTYVWFLWSQWFNPNTSLKKRLILIFGYYVPHIILISFFTL